MLLCFSYFMLQLYWTRLSDFPFTFHFHALEKEMVPHSSVVAWRIPGTGEPGGLPSLGSHRVGHDWSDLAAAAAYWVVSLKSMLFYVFSGFGLLYAFPCIWNVSPIPPFTWLVLFILQVSAYAGPHLLNQGSLLWLPGKRSGLPAEYSKVPYNLYKNTQHTLMLIVL